MVLLCKPILAFFPLEKPFKIGIRWWKRRNCRSADRWCRRWSQTSNTRRCTCVKLAKSCSSNLALSFLIQTIEDGTILASNWLRQCGFLRCGREYEIWRSNDFNWAGYLLLPQCPGPRSGLIRFLLWLGLLTLYRRRNPLIIFYVVLSNAWLSTRPKLLQVVKSIVKGCRRRSDAIQAINVRMAILL